VTARRDLRKGPLARERHAYVIRNARLEPEAENVRRSIFTIAGRAISSMIHYSGSNDIFRLYATSLRDGVDFNLAVIGADFGIEHREDFDPDYMRALFEYAYAKARNGYPWLKGPPALASAEAWQR